MPPDTSPSANSALVSPEVVAPNVFGKPFRLSRSAPQIADIHEPKRRFRKLNQEFATLQSLGRAQEPQRQFEFRFCQRPLADLKETSPALGMEIEALVVDGRSDWQQIQDPQCHAVIARS